MADAIIRPSFGIPRTSGISPGFVDIGGATESGFGAWVAKASISSDEILELWFRMPGTSLPSGTGKLVFEGIANATTGDLDINVKWKSFAIEEDINNPTLNAEGKLDLTWSTGDDWDIKQQKVTLDADTLVAGEWVMMHLTIEAASTLAAVCGFDAFIVFE